MRSRLTQLRPAFTLIELMISIFLALLLMLGVNRVFQMVSQTVGAGSAITSMSQTGRAIQATMSSDFYDATGTSMPFLIIQCQQQTAFMDALDMASDSAWSTSPTEANMRNINGQTLSPALYSTRSHRCDRIGFFGSGKYHTLTGLEVNNPPFISSASSRQAFIWYGHVQLGNGASPPFGTDNGGNQDQWPGQMTLPNNPNNWFARDWTLGRCLILLADPIPTNPVTGVPYTGYIKYTAPGTFAGTYANQFDCSPLNDLDVTSNPATTPIDYNSMIAARYDLANITMTELQSQCQLTWSSNNNGFNQMNYRFQCVPAIAKPITPANLSSTLPLWARNCSGFIVEFAGDFLKQNPDGTLIQTTGNPSDGWEGQDGVTDFLIDPKTGQQKIRWYGLPRDANGDGSILGQTAVACPKTYSTTAKYNPNYLVDVVPLRDVLLTTGDAAVTTASIESTMNVITPIKADYGAAATAMDPFIWNTGGKGQYFVGWRAGLSTPRPSLIRFIITLEDPTGRAAGRTYEYVMALQ